MDYSLMVAVDEVILPRSSISHSTNANKARKELVVGIIDVVRTYTWVCRNLLHSCSSMLTVTGQKARVLDQRYEAPITGSQRID
jgi:hypothetical protein